MAVSQSNGETRQVDPTEYALLQYNAETCAIYADLADLVLDNKGSQENALSELVSLIQTKHKNPA
jgi:hypothetical protein